MAAPASHRRRRWIGVAVAAAAIAAATLTRRSWRPAPDSPVGGPIILISIDTLRADHLPAYGYRAVTTPAIDRLAADGVLFERAYSHAPQTLPAHASMLSGRLPFQHGVRDNVGFQLKDVDPLLPDVLRARGFATGGVASAYVLRRETGIAKGFDFYDANMPPAAAGASLDEAQRDGAASLAIAEQWMAAQPSPRLFLFLHLYEPHAPYTPPPQHARAAPYDGEIAYADEIVGRLLQWLADRRWYDAATIVLASDHGEGLSDHGEQEHGLFLYEEAVHVPLILKLPGRREHGRRVKELVQHVDLMPTLADLAGAHVPAGLPGRSLRDLIEGRTGRWPARGVYSEALFGWYHFGWSDLAALTDERYRFIRAPKAELYDLQRDPAERVNLAAERTQNRAAMQAALEALTANAARPQPETVAPEVRQRLMALGYVGARSGAASDAAGTPAADPKDKVEVLVRYRQALQLVADGQLAAAVSVLTALTRDEPAMTDLWPRIGRLQLRLGRTADAVVAFKQAVQVTPTSTPLYIELASALLKLERIQDAQAHAELAAKVAAPTEPAERAAAYEMLAKIALARQDAAAARRYAGLAQQADPGLPVAPYVEARLAYASGRYSDAWAQFSIALESSRARTAQMPDLHLYAGDTLAQLGRFEDAEREFKEEIRVFPTNTWAYLSLANLYRLFGRLDASDRVLAEMVRAVPSPDAIAQAARLRGGPR